MMTNSAMMNSSYRIFDDLLEGYQIIDEEFRYRYLNKTAVRQSKKSSEELIGRTMMECFPGIEQTEMFGLLERCMKERTGQSTENHFFFADGSSGWFELRMEPVPEGIFILSIDITARKIAEKRIQNINRLYAMLSKVNHTIVHARSRDDLFQNICTICIENGRYEQAWIGLVDNTMTNIIPVQCEGIIPKEFLSTAIMINQEELPHSLLAFALHTGNVAYSNNVVMDPRLQNEFQQTMLRDYRSAAAVPFRLNGKIEGILFLSSPEAGLFSDEKQYLLLEEMSLDISFSLETLSSAVLRQQAEEKERDLLDRLKKISSHIPGVIYQYRLRPDGTSHFPYASDGIREIYGITPQEVSEDAGPVFEVLHPEDRDRIAHSILRSAELGHRWHESYRVILPSGKMQWVEGNATPKKQADGSVLWHGYIADITQRKRLDEQNLRLQRMESVGALAGGIVHDMNNILGPIMMALQSLKRKASDPKDLKMIEVLENNSKRGAELVKQILTFARGSTSNPMPLRLSFVVDEMVKLITRTFPANIHVENLLPPNLWSISGDLTQIHQVVMNLSVNARDAMPLGGTITYDAENITLDHQSARMFVDANPGMYVLLRIRDTGIGMSPEVRQKMFEPFFTTKEFGKGTGLGLSTVFSIVKGHGGFLNVYSELGKGTEFKIYLPAVESNEMKAEKNDPMESMQGNSEMVLLVDDDAVILEIAALCLQAGGYRVVAAKNGAEAVALFAQHQHDIRLVITDIEMPVMDGPALAKVLTAMNSSVTIIGSSGLNESGRVKEAKAAGMKGFLSKPYTSETLMKTIHESMFSNGSSAAVQ